MGQWQSTRLPPICPKGSNPGVNAIICGLCLMVVLFFAPRRFSTVTMVFPSSQKPAFPNSNFTRNKIDEESLRGCATSKIVIKSLLEPELFIFSSFYFRLQGEIHFFHRPKRICPGMNICCMTLKGNCENFVELPSPLQNF